MPTVPLDPIRRFSTALYALAVVLVLIPLMDSAPVLLSKGPSATLWRFGAVALLSRTLLLPLTGYVLAMLVAFHAEHRRVRWTLTAIGFAFTTIALLTLPLAGLDTIELLRRAPVPQQGSVKLTAVLLVIRLLALITVTLFVAIRGRPRQQHGHAHESSSGYVVSSRGRSGRSSTARAPEPPPEGASAEPEPTPPVT